jgi:predicted nucleic acid-binding protein
LILVDSTLYIDWLQRRVDFPRLLEPWVRSRSLWLCGVIRVEVIRGILNPKQRVRVEEFFDLIPDIPTDPGLWTEVTSLAWRLDRKGKVLPLADLIISAGALSVGARVVSLDRHFWEVPGLGCQSELPNIH